MDDIRWIQRFDNFTRACGLLSEIKIYEIEDTPAIIREGFIQRFELTFELAWKTLKDFLEFEGVNVSPTPRNVIKEAFATNIIADGQIFIDMLEARNLVTHKYDEETFDTVFVQIKESFQPALEDLRGFLEDKK